MKDMHHEDLMTMLKALADDSRLALLRLVAQNEITVGDLAESVGLGEPTVSHHLSRLRAANLVTLRMAGNQRFYRLNDSGLEQFKRLAAVIEKTPDPTETEPQDQEWINNLGWGLWESQVLREYTRGQQLTRLPSKQKKLEVVLRWLSGKFEPDRLYSEAEVNAILKDVYAEDFISVRRDMVDLGYLRRERGGGKYWLAPEGAKET
jgi:hypothetical protein